MSAGTYYRQGKLKFNYFNHAACESHRDTNSPWRGNSSFATCIL